MNVVKQSNVDVKRISILVGGEREREIRGSGKIIILSKFEKMCNFAYAAGT